MIRKTNAARTILFYTRCITWAQISSKPHAVSLGLCYKWYYYVRLAWHTITYIGRTEVCQSSQIYGNKMSSIDSQLTFNVHNQSQRAMSSNWRVMVMRLFFFLPTVTRCSIHLLGLWINISVYNKTVLGRLIVYRHGVGRWGVGGLGILKGYSSPMYCQRELWIIILYRRCNNHKLVAVINVF